MDKRSAQRLEMLKNLLSFIAQNPVVVAMVLIFKSGSVTLQNFVNQIIALQGPQSQSVAGGGAAKSDDRTALNQLTYAIINAARGYFLSIGDKNTAVELNQSLSKIQKITDKKIAGRALYWFGIINPVIGQLDQWGLKPETMDTWNQSILAYQNTETLPATKRENKKQKTKQAKDLIAQALQLCEDTLDTSALSYIELNQKDFYNEYRSYRIIHSVNTTHTKFKVRVTDELNQPIYNVQILQDGTDNKVTTDINGDATLYIKTKKGAKPVYTFTISKGTKSISSGNIQISKGQTATQNYVLATDGFVIPQHQPQIETVPA
jgi:hypothetical protein